MKITDLLEQFRFDKRLVDWNMKHGAVSKTELDKHLASLEDISSNVERLDLEDDSNTNESMN